MTSTNHHNDDDQEGRAPPTRAEVLADVMTLAMKFSTCCEAFNLIHPHNSSDHHQKVALAKLGIQQGRLLIWGDIVGISSPPATIATHMIPSHPGITNPDPTMPINFAVRDPRLDQPELNAKIHAALDHMAGRPSNMSRETLMLQYGLKSPKNFSATIYAALDSNRLEAFREKFALLKDLVRQVGVQGHWQRAGSMTMQKWTVRNSDRFDDFVALVRNDVDGLVNMMGVQEQVDRGMKTDIKSMAWHPDLTVTVVRADWDKLKLIREAAAEDYPEYEETADRALKYISDELRDLHFPGVKLSYTPRRPIRRRSSTPADNIAKKPLANVESKPALSPTTPVSAGADTANNTSPTPFPEKERKSSFMSKLGLKSWGRQKNQASKRTNDVSAQQPPSHQGESLDPPRSFSEDIEKPSFDYQEDVAPTRSKSLSAVASPRPRMNIDTVLAEGSTTTPMLNTSTTVATQNNYTDSDLTQSPTTNGSHPASSSQRPEGSPDAGPQPAKGEKTSSAANDDNPLTTVETVKSLVDRHDMYRDLGRLETNDIRQKSKAAALGY